MQDQRNRKQPGDLPRAEEICPFLPEVKGFLASEEGRVLQEAGFEASDLGPCLEIGGYCGLSSIYLGLGVRERGGVLFSVDHHHGSEEHQPGEEFFDPDLLDPLQGRPDSFPEFRRNLQRAGLQDTVVPLVCTSELAARMWATPLALVFIDGGHSQEAAFADYEFWSRHILPGGFLAIHDIFFDPAQGGQAPRQVYERALHSGMFQEHRLVESLGVLLRRD
ncbi:MAG: class I SAM-dependent methyltransferase [Desulfohalobiaceae bacterium]